MNFQKGRYGIYIAREIGHFAYDLRIRRNHFCWIRDVKLLQDSKNYNFWNLYVSMEQENVFCQFGSTGKGPFFKRSQNSTKLVLLGPYRQNIARFIFREFLESVCGPGKLKYTFESNIECSIF